MADALARRKAKPQTIQKEAERELVRQQVIAARSELVAAQIAHACGISYMVLRNPDGTYTRATNEAQLNAGIAAGGDAFQIFTQAPNVQAFTDLMNRALDKPAEQVRLTGAEDGPVELVFKWGTPDNATPTNGNDQERRARARLKP